MLARLPLLAAAAAAALALTPAPRAEACGSPTTADAPNLVEVAKAAGGFDTLLAAATAAGLVPVLSGDGPFTVFAPTDEAFAKLPAGTVAALLKDKAKLAAILTYHVVPGKVMASQAAKLDGAETVNGKRVTLRTEGRTVRVDDARVVKADIEASNGVIHVIDRVILPPSES